MAAPSGSKLFIKFYQRKNDHVRANLISTFPSVRKIRVQRPYNSHRNQHGIAVAVIDDTEAATLFQTGLNTVRPIAGETYEFTLFDNSLKEKVEKKTHKALVTQDGNPGSENSDVKSKDIRDAFKEKFQAYNINFCHQPRELQGAFQLHLSKPFHATEKMTVKGHTFIVSPLYK